MPKVYHLDLSKKMLKGAQVALLPGDPARVEIIAGHVAGAYSSIFEKIASKREFTSFLAGVKGKHVVITSTGIGGPSTSIAVEELARLGVRTFIRVGTAGAIQEYIDNGDCVITTGAVRLDGASTHYAPMEYPAVAHHECVSALIEGAKRAGVRFHTGITASSDTFYPGEERKDSYRKYVIKRFQGSTREWKNLQVLNYEMESATLLTMTASMGLKGGCVTGVVNRGSVGTISPKALSIGQENAIKTACLALDYLVD